MNYNRDLTHPDTAELNRLQAIANKTCPVCGSDLENTFMPGDSYIVACTNNKNYTENPYTKCLFHISHTAFIRISKQYGNKD